MSEDLEWDFSSHEMHSPDPEPINQQSLVPLVPRYSSYVLDKKTWWQLSWLVFSVFNIPFTVGFSVFLDKWMGGIDISLGWVKFGVNIPIMKAFG